MAEDNGECLSVLYELEEVDLKLIVLPILRLSTTKTLFDIIQKIIKHGLLCYGRWRWLFNLFFPVFTLGLSTVVICAGDSRLPYAIIEKSKETYINWIWIDPSLNSIYSDRPSNFGFSGKFYAFGLKFDNYLDSTWKLAVRFANHIAKVGFTTVDEARELLADNLVLATLKLQENWDWIGEGRIKDGLVNISNSSLFVSSEKNSKQIIFASLSPEMV